MIIDFHTHIFADELAPKGLAVLRKNAGAEYTPTTDMTLGSLRRYMNNNGIDKCVVVPIATKQSQTVRINEWAASVDSEDVICFGSIYPHTDDYKRDIDMVCSLGLKGIKLHAEYQQFDVDDPEMLPIYEYAFSKGLIIVQHAGYDPIGKEPFRSSPRMFAKVADELKGGVMVAAHLGGQKQWDDVEKCLAGKNIWLDTSMGSRYYSREQFLRIVEKHGSDKILFGSDSPWSDAREEADFILDLPLSRTDKDKILHANAEELLTGDCHELL